MKYITFFLAICLLWGECSMAQGMFQKSKKNDWIESDLKGRVKSIKVDLKYDIKDRESDRGFIEIDFNEMGYIIETSQDNYMTDFSGTRKFIYDDNQNMIERRELSLDGVLYSRTISTYDLDGNKTEDRQYYDGNNLIERDTYETIQNSVIKKRYISGDLSDITTSTYDQKGNLIEESFRYVSIEGGHKSTFKHDGKQNVIEHIQYEANGRLLRKCLYKYDMAGNRVEETEFDHHEKLINKIGLKYNEKGDKVESIKYNAKGIMQGKTISKYLYDKTLNWIKQTDFEYGKPTSVTERSIQYY